MTWSKKHRGKDLVQQRNDKGLATQEWCDSFPNVIVLHLDVTGTVDHKALFCLLHCDQHFAFERWSENIQECEVVIHNAWEGHVLRVYLASVEIENWPV